MDTYCFHLGMEMVDADVTVELPTTKACKDGSVERMVRIHNAKEA